MASNIRRQLTLFVDGNDAASIEQLRQKFNPKQFELIKCHVTLCREDEIENLEKVIANLSHLSIVELSIEFGKVARFDDGKGVFLPAIDENPAFQELRKKVLEGIIENPRKQEAHITLMHPRNSTCTNSIFEEIEKERLPSTIKFKKISLIEQVNGGIWRILQEFEC